MEHRRRSSTTIPARSRREWLVRGGLAAITASLGFISVSQSLAFAIHKAAPERAYAISPSDGRIGAQLVEKLLVSPLNQAQWDRVAHTAHKALLSEPLAVSAIVALGMNAQLRGDISAARRLFAHSDAVSRRNLATRLWLIEDAVSREDISGAVHNYDIALRTSNTASQILFPILSAAIADPRISAAVIPILARRPAWAPHFIRYVARSGPEPEVRARFLRSLAKNSIPISEAAQADVVNALVATKAYVEAWDYYLAVRGPLDRRRSRDPGFTSRILAPTAFDWNPVTTNPGVAAAIQRDDRDGQFDFATPPTVGGVLLQQIQLLPPGQYRIQGRSIGIDQMRDAMPYWSLACIDGPELGRIEIVNSASRATRFAGTVRVGGHCPAQVLRLVARPSNVVTGVTGQIDEISLTPAGEVP